jgi:L-threonylcarbamoyladenylate synthase
MPVAAPSANLFSRPSPTRASHVLQDLDGRIDMILDGGVTRFGVESTVLDLTGEFPRVLRPGAVTLEDLRSILPGVRTSTGSTGDVQEDAPMSSPGLLPKHYAPRTPLRLYTGDPQSLRGALVQGARAALAANMRVGVLATVEDADALRGLRLVIAELGPETDAAAIASRLYAALRELDESGLDLILARAVEVEEGLGRAIQDRLRRAASEIERVP